MKRVLTLIAVLAAALPITLGGGPATAATTSPAIFFSPHQDDETLSFGADIRNHVLAGRQVIVVLLTDGSSTAVCQNRYGKDADGYTTADRATCTAERDTEWRNAVTDLGATPVIPTDRAQDGSLTEAEATAIMAPYAAQYPDASFKTTTYHEADLCTSHPGFNCEHSPIVGNPDHAAAGEALRDLPGTTGDKRFYIKPEEWAMFPTLGAFQPRQPVGNSLLDYAAPNFTGIGYLSVKHDWYEQASPGYCSCGTAQGYYNAGGADSKYHKPGQ